MTGTIDTHLEGKLVCGGADSPAGVGVEVVVGDGDSGAE